VRLEFGNPAPTEEKFVLEATALLRQKIFALNIGPIERAEIIALIHDIETARDWRDFDDDDL